MSDINSLVVVEPDCFDPYMNLAIEEYILSKAKEGEKILFLWQNDKSLIVGRNQSVFSQCMVDRAKELGVKIVRRKSGGGTVFHDLGNLNFSFISRENEESFKDNYKILIAALGQLGIKAEVSGRNDIMVDEKKVSGNAFLSVKNAICHHGTLLVSSDLKALKELISPKKIDPSIKEIDSVRSKVINLCDIDSSINVKAVKEAIIFSFESIYKQKAVRINSLEAITEDVEAVIELSKEYSSEAFIYGKEKCGDLACNDSFSWGNVSVSLSVKDNRIGDCKIITDALETELISHIEKALVNAKLSYNDIHNRFLNISFSCAQKILLDDIEGMIDKLIIKLAEV